MCIAMFFVVFSDIAWLDGRQFEKHERCIICQQFGVCEVWCVESTKLAWRDALNRINAFLFCITAPIRKLLFKNKHQGNISVSRPNYYPLTSQPLNITEIVTEGAYKNIICYNITIHSIPYVNAITARVPLNTPPRSYI